MQVSNGKIVELLQTLRTAECTHLVVKRTYRYNDKSDMPEITQAINGKCEGDKFTVHTAGFKDLTYNELLRQKVPRKNIKCNENLQIGTCLISKNQHCEYWAVVKEIDDEYAVLDANHHLMGKDVYFDIEILSVKNSDTEPTPQEQSGILIPQH